jgi:serine/threonine protein kinase
MIREPEVGDRLDGRFTILEHIARGGWSSVFKAIDGTTGCFVAVKVPLPHVESDPAGFSRYQREAKIGEGLDHPAIPKFVRVDEATKSRPYVAMEYLEGQTLADWLGEMGALPERDALGITLRICDGLEYLHRQKIVHRDLKPGNIMLCPDGSLRIMDFGIAAAGGARRLTFGGFSPRAGTPDYMAPEQVKGQRGDARIDVYGVGAVLYEMVTGHRPFEADTDYERMTARLVGDPVAPRRHNAAVSPQVEEIILHALARDPANRYASIEAMVSDLKAPEQVDVIGRADRLTVPVLRNEWWWVAKVVCIALVLPIVLFFVFLRMFRRS